MLMQALRSMLPETPPTPDLEKEYQELCERTLARQKAKSAEMKAAGTHVLAGYTPPKDVDLDRTFRRVRDGFRKANIRVLKRSSN